MLRDPIAAGATVADLRGRPLRDLRVSVTDRCNLRCAYCMPEEHYRWLPHESHLSVVELATVIEAFVATGVRKVRLTGGEPLLRRDLPDLVARIAAMGQVSDLALTTNGTLLAGAADDLRLAGLSRVTVSLDTLHAGRHLALTRRDNHADVLAGLEAVAAVGFSSTKINTVVMRGVNDDELVDLVRFARTVGAEVRFIEYMDVGGATRWSPESVVGAAEIIERVSDALGPVAAAAARPSAPARRYSTADGHTFGIVASTSTPFCATCDRSRLTSDGHWFHCLYAEQGIDLGRIVRGGADTRHLEAFIRDRWSLRQDQGALDRLGLDDRRATPVQILRSDPHREMHTRGG